MSIRLGGGKQLKSEGLLRVVCRQLPRILLLFALIACSLSANTIIQFQVAAVGTTGGQTLYRYTYAISGVAFVANEELDIQFAPALFGQISNGVAPAGFDLLLFQPNNPPQAAGDYSALATVDHPSLAGPFSVDFTFTGPGTPGSQAYSINQFDSNLNFVGVVTSGGTTASPVSGVPEPASFSLCGAVLIIGGVFLAVRRRPVAVS
jgi:hypothetical protein